MAKKGQAVQLQLEVNNDDEWNKLMQKEGLIGINNLEKFKLYLLRHFCSDWCVFWMVWTLLRNASKFEEN